MAPEKGGYDDIRRMRDLLMIFDVLISMNRQQEAKQVLQRINSLNQSNPEDFRIHLITWNGGTTKIGTPIVNNLGEITILRNVLDDWLAIAEPYANSYLANFCRLNRARLKEVAAMANKFKGRGNMMESKKIKLNETQLKRIIKEAVEGVVMDSQTPSNWDVRVTIPMTLDLSLQATSEKEAINQAKDIIKKAREEDFDVDFNNPRIVAIPANLFGED